ncbi:hypothetical protein QF205_10305 [Luteimonas composti]|uniref:Lipoprotein n=1 Tax=Luteimonas composti TaxID=398257 RepID=A0ABT6MS56_9GAMM|nr:hypothetical protein [Luteimonas composti]MDH7453456.1 hypothetical protein [Luteimonas composti]
MRNWTALWILLGVTCLAACRTVPADPPPPVANVEVALVPPPPGATRMQLEASQAFVFPLLVESELPVYPPDLLALRLAPQTLCVEVDIDADGVVGDVRPREGVQCPGTGPHRARFAALLEESVRRWRFDPALVCRTSDGRASPDACAEPDSIDTPVALRLSYAVVFSQEDGQPVVELASGAGGGRSR